MRKKKRRILRAADTDGVFGCVFFWHNHDLVDTADTGGCGFPWVRLFVGIVSMHLQ